jgi:hypothetical protein
MAGCMIAAFIISCKKGQPTEPVQSGSTNLRIDSISPKGRRPGSTITIYGGGFGADIKATSITFESQQLSLVSVDTNKIIAIVPDVRGEGPIFVNHNYKTVKSHDSLSVWKGGIISFSPNIGFPNDTGKLAIFDYGPYSGVIKVWVGKYQTTLASATSSYITFIIPDRVGLKDIIRLEYVSDTANYLTSDSIQIVSHISFFSSMTVEWYDLSFKTLHTLLSPFDSTYITNGLASDTHTFKPQSIFVDQNNVSTAKHYDSTGNGKPGSLDGINTYITNITASYQIDTATKTLSQFRLVVSGKHSYEGEACLGCGNYEYDTLSTLQLHSVPYSVQPDHSIIALVSGPAINSLLDKLDYSTSDIGSGYYHQQPNIRTSVLAVNPSPSSSYIKITISP